MNIIDRDICEVLDDKMMEFSAYTILHRAIPSLEDGFKVSLRRILYTMYKENMTKLTKSANVSGQVMKIHPHGDCYPTIVNMVQKDNHSNPFIDGKGAFAYHTSRDTQPASARYTEVKIAPYSLDMMNGLKKNSVEMMPTFDGSMTEPIFLPTQHPNILTHAQEGLGVGMACKFPSFNLSEVCDCAISHIQDGTQTNLIPDFPTGGYIIDNPKQIESINKTGVGSVILQSKYVVDGDYILIKEIPYTTTREVVIEKIIELVKANKLKEVADIKDTTDLNGMEIEIKIRKNTDPDMLMAKLHKLTPLQSSLSANMNCLSNNKPQVLGVHQIIEKWTDFRKTCIKREIQYDIDQNKKELTKLQGLEIILSDLDKAISIIRSSKSEKQAIERLAAHFNLNQEQVDYIVTIRLVNMNEDWLNGKISKLCDIAKSVETMERNINNNTYINNVIITQLQEIKKKYGKPRRTTILHESEIEDITQEDLIEDYNCQIVLTKQGYIKKTLRYSDVQKVKDGDSLLFQIPSTNKSKLLLFTNKGNCYYLNCHELDNVQPSSLGSYLPTLLQLENEEIIYIVSTINFKGCLLFAFQNGKVAKINLSSYETKTNRTKVVNAYNLNSPLVSIHHMENDMDFMAISDIKKILVFNTSLISSKGSKSSQGVNVLKSKNDSLMVDFKPCDDELLKDMEYYRSNIPAVGKYLKK